MSRPNKLGCTFVDILAVLIGIYIGLAILMSVINGIFKLLAIPFN